MSSIYYNNLLKVVLDNSYSKNWVEAVTEWEVIDCEEDEEVQSAGICGKENIKYLFTIQNRITGKSLFPIGSSCIRKFEQSNLNYTIGIYEGMHNLYSSIRENIRIELNSQFFTRAILKYLFEDGAFDSYYNNYNYL